MKVHQGILILGNDLDFVNRLRQIILNQQYWLKAVATVEECRAYLSKKPVHLVVVCDDLQADTTDLVLCHKLYGLNRCSFDDNTFMTTVRNMIGPSHVEVPETEPGLEIDEISPCGHGESFVTSLQDAVIQDPI